MKRYAFILAGALGLSTSFSALCASPDAIEIVRRVDGLEEGKTSQSDLQMELVDQNGNVRQRSMRAIGKNTPDLKAKTLMFLGPSDVKGTAYLSIDYISLSKTDDAWLYLPALRKVKRVASTAKSDAFMGSDFTYSDINGTISSDWNFRIIKDSDIVDDQDCWVLESVPKADRQKKVLEETGYSKRQIWVRKDNYFVVKGMFFIDRENKTKEMSVKDVRKVDGIWVGHKIEMRTVKNEQVQHTTRLEFKNVVFNKPVNEELFSPQSIERGGS